MALLIDMPYPLPPLVMTTDGIDRHYEAVQALREEADALPDDEIVGRVLAFQRGDGYALYLVVHEDPLIVQWLPFMDRWRVEDALIRGLTAEDVLAKARERRALRTAFGDRP